MFNFLRERLAYSTVFGEKITLPPANWMPETAKYTPDLAELEEKDYWWMFVCDETQSGHHRDWLMDPEEPKYEAFTAKEDYVLWRKYLGLKTVAIPLIADTMSYVKHMKLNGELMYPPARLKGQLFKILPKHFKELDEYKENGVVFSRRRVNILIPYSTLDDDVNHLTSIQYIQAWMYEGRPDFWRSFGDSPLFVPSRPIKSKVLGKMKMDHYYQFNNKDYSIGKVTGAPAIVNGREQTTENNKAA